MTDTAIIVGIKTDQVRLSAEGRCCLVLTSEGDSTVSKYEGVFERYSDHSPTQFDSNIDIDRSDWYVMPVSQTRDSQPLDQSNFDCFLKALEGESETVEVHRFGHWGPGWYEIILVQPDDVEKLDTAYDMASALQDYPVLDDEDNSRRESEAAAETWDNHAAGEFRKALMQTVESPLDEFSDSEPADIHQRWCKHWGLDVDLCGCGDCIETESEWLTGLSEFVDNMDGAVLRKLGEDEFELTWEMHNDGVYFSWSKSIDIQHLCDTLDDMKAKLSEQVSCG